ncbi:MAG: DUF1631 family protein [Burkholderiales bacterium]|nr:DUF1631 family protein [Burkholderiales bacterium]
MKKAALLAKVRDVFESLINEKLDRVLQTVAETLLAKADASRSNSEAGLLLDARVVVVSRGEHMKADISTQLHRVIDRALQTAFRGKSDHLEPAADPNSPLSLLDTSVIEAKLELESLATKIRNAAEAEIGDFNIRVSHLYRQSVVQERENPFRPYTLANALVSGIGGLGLVQELSSTLARELIDAYCDEVEEIYRALNTMLAENQISADMPLLTRTTTSMPRSATARRAIDGPAPVLPTRASGDSLLITKDSLLGRWVQMKLHPNQPDGPSLIPPDAGASWLDQTLDAGERLRRLFRLQMGDEAQKPVFTTFAGSSALADAIRRLEADVQTSGSQQDETHLRNHVFEHRGRLGSMTQSSDEHMVVDVVAMLYEFILRDGQVPVGVRADLGRTQFLILRHGLFDPEIFSTPHHPARRLMNRIGSVAMGFSPADPATVAIRDEITRTVDSLLSAPTVDVDLFSKTLQHFEQFIDHTLRTTDRAVGRAVRVLEDAETRVRNVIVLSNEIGALLRGLSVNPRISSFLVNTWAFVLERAGREHPDRVVHFRKIVPHLVWSVLPKTGNESRVNMLKLLPTMVTTLSEGLALTRWSLAEREDFLEWLVNAHVLAMRDQPGVRAIELPTIEAHFEGFITEGTDAPGDEGTLPFDPGFVAEVASELGTPIELLDARLDTASKHTVLDLDRSPMDEAYKASVVSRLRTGIIVEFLLAGIPRRARLNWVSARASSLLLTVEEMETPSVISAKLFLELLSREEVRFMESEPMFERAVASLLRAADEMESWFDASQAPQK